jgi:hypothetical protein
MRLGPWTALAMGSAAIAALLALAEACSGLPHVPRPSAVSEGSCKTEPGGFPPPSCDDTHETCTAPMPACETAPCGGPCLAMSDNTGKAADLRIRKLLITAPPQLRTNFLQSAIIDQGVNLKNACGEGGDGSFSWLIHFDTAGKVVVTGGAPPTPDPFGVGYCFVKEKIAALDVEPVTVAMTQNADGTWSSDVIPKLNVPIYVHGSASNVVILPLTNARVQNVSLSPDGNCIGRYNPLGVSVEDVGGTCSDQDVSQCQRWHPAGSLGGLITLEEADGVFIQDVDKSLCVLLTTAAATKEGLCPRDPTTGKIAEHGDFCSLTNSPGGCMDSSWLAAAFAASAAKINDGSGDPACNGSGVAPGPDAASDAGTDSG